MNRWSFWMSWLLGTCVLACGSDDDEQNATGFATDDPTGHGSAANDASGTTAASVGDGPPPDLGGVDGGTADTGGSSLDDLDDEFDGTLAQWNVYSPHLADVSVDDGELVLEPGASTVWLDGDVSVLLWQPVAGDFVATAAVTARRAGDPTALPAAGFRFGGLMARDPDEADGQNYVFVVLGTDVDPSVETKSTTDSQSEYVGPPWPDASGEVRICRVGATFRLFVRSGGAWEQSNQFVRTDLPELLQVGPIAYNNDPDPDLRVRVDFIDFEEVASLDDCGA